MGQFLPFSCKVAGGGIVGGVAVQDLAARGF